MDNHTTVCAFICHIAYAKFRKKEEEEEESFYLLSWLKETCRIADWQREWLSTWGRENRLTSVMSHTNTRPIWLPRAMSWRSRRKKKGRRIGREYNKEKMEKKTGKEKLCMKITHTSKKQTDKYSHSSLTSNFWSKPNLTYQISHKVTSNLKYNTCNTSAHTLCIVPHHV